MYMTVGEFLISHDKNGKTNISHLIWKNCYRGPELRTVHCLFCYTNFHLIPPVANTLRNWLFYHSMQFVWLNSIFRFKQYSYINTQIQSDSTKFSYWIVMNMMKLVIQIESRESKFKMVTEIPFAILNFKNERFIRFKPIAKWVKPLAWHSYVWCLLLMLLVVYNTAFVCIIPSFLGE